MGLGKENKGGVNQTLRTDFLVKEFQKGTSAEKRGGAKVGYMLYSRARVGKTRGWSMLRASSPLSQSYFVDQGWCGLNIRRAQICSRVLAFF